MVMFPELKSFPVAQLFYYHVVQQHHIDDYVIIAQLSLGLAVRMHQSNHHWSIQSSIGYNKEL